MLIAASSRGAHFPSKLQGDSFTQGAGTFISYFYIIEVGLDLMMVGYNGMACYQRMDIEKYLNI